MNISDFDYELPEELIAQKPSDKRDESRLMVLDRTTGTIEHRHFYNILEYLREGDVLVMNNSKVIPARLFGRRLKAEAVPEGEDRSRILSGLTENDLGAHVEFLLIKRLEGDKWETMVKPGKKCRIGDIIIFNLEPYFAAEITGYGDDGTRIAEFQYQGIFMERLEEMGSMPLPPYIRRESELSDKDRYQTVYARYDGSVAAPTAGLHFTEEILKAAEAKGVQLAYVTLHVGIGTFRPVKVDKVEDHHMHFEEYEVSEETAEIVNRAIDEGRRIIAVGTTSTRTLESAAAAASEPEVCSKTGFAGDCYREHKSGQLHHIKAGASSTGIFIYPGYEFKIVDCQITNFHLPKSTLIMLISALYNREDVLKAYECAVTEKYRFFSYGDAMLIK